MPPSPCTHLRKRDNRLVPFEPAKLCASIEAAARACGCDSGFFAREIADAVALHLAHASADAPPATAAVAEAVERVLHELRYHEVARAYHDYRQQRDDHRARCTVIKTTQPSLFPADLAPHLTVAYGSHHSPWERARIVHALEREARLGRAVAEDIARCVEEKILASDLRRVTTTLIRALTDNELLARGYTSALRQRSSVTVPFQDVERLLAAPDALAGQLGRDICRPYVMARVYSDDVADAHQRGMLELGGLDHPFSEHRAVCRLPDDTHAAAIAAHAYLWQQRLATAHTAELVVELPDDLGAAQYDTVLQIWHAAAAALEGTARVHFAVPAARCTEWSQRLPAIAPVRQCAVLVYGETADAHTLADIVSACHARGWQLAWLPGGLPAPAAQLITINMPQAVYRARGHDLDSVIEELYRGVDLAAHAHRQFRQFQRAHGRARAASHPGVLTCAGLDEAVAVLSGTGVFDSADSTKCLRVMLGVLHDGVRSIAHAQQLPVCLRMGESITCGQRLAAIDQALFPELFGFLPLSSDALEHVIPPYQPLRLALDTARPVQATIAAAQHVVRCVEQSVLPLEPGGLDAAGLHTCLHALISASCGFVLPPADVPA